MTTRAEELRLWREFTESSSWKKLLEILQGQIDGMQSKVILTPLASADGIFAQEFAKGPIEGRLSIFSTAEAIMEELEGDENGRE